MKNLIIILAVLLFSSCTQQYIALDKDGSVIQIIDKDNLIQDAISLDAEFIYVTNSTLGLYGDKYTPVDFIGEDDIKFYNDSINNKEYSWVVTYRKLRLSDLKEK